MASSPRGPINHKADLKSISMVYWAAKTLNCWPDHSTWLRFWSVEQPDIFIYFTHWTSEGNDPRSVIPWYHNESKPIQYAVTHAYSNTACGSWIWFWVSELIKYSDLFLITAYCGFREMWQCGNGIVSSWKPKVWDVSLYPDSLLHHGHHAMPAELHQHTIKLSEGSTTIWCWIFPRNHNRIVTFSVIPQCWLGASCSNILSWTTRTPLSYFINSMIAGDPRSQGISIQGVDQFSGNSPVSAWVKLHV